MNHLKQYLRRNTMLRFIQRNVFDNKPLKIDHIAHRSFKQDLIKNDYLKKYNGFYLEKDFYNFDNHNAYALWLNFKGDKNNNEYINSLHLFDKTVFNTPRIFISTYKDVYDDKNLINSDIDLDLVQWYILNKNKVISYELYRKIFDKNQYLAWTLVHRNNINHIGIEVENIEEILNKTKNMLFLNNPEAPLQISEDGDLLQFSCKSSIFPFHFSDGTYEIPRNFVEFIERKNNREGFSEKNANVVFNSTK